MRGRGQALATLMGLVVFPACSPPETVFNGFGDGAHTLRVVNREGTRIDDRNGVRLSPGSGNGVAWVEGTDFRSGTIEVDIRGREDLQQHYVGVAFHRQDDNTYEAVYLRPFNFRAQDPARRQHAVQYIKLPEFDFQPLRDQFPEEFENPVASWIEPTDWVRLRVVTTHFDRVVLMLDGDKAGEDGAAAIGRTLAPRLSVATISLQQGTQPDQLPSRAIQRALWRFATTVRAADGHDSNLSERVAGAPSDH